MGLILVASMEVRGADPLPVIVRDHHAARWWALPIAALLAWRERRVMRRLDGLRGVPRLLEQGRGLAVRSFIPGEVFSVARPGDPAVYQRARRLLRDIHRRNVTHDDTHKEANWLLADDGSPALIDFQLAIHHRRRGAFFRSCALEDHRHLLKHKRRHCGHALTASERSLLKRRSWIARNWMRTVKPVYLFVTRRILKTRDGEGRGHGKPTT